MTTSCMDLAEELESKNMSQTTNLQGGDSMTNSDVFFLFK